MHAAQAFRDHLPIGLERAKQRQPWQAGDPALPALYISHGAPPLMEDAKWIAELAAWADGLPVPQAILIVSAHWEAAPLALSSTRADVDPVYDFAGFHPDYFRMRYDTPDAQTLRDLLVAVLPDGTQVHEHQRRGLDHGAWIPLKIMYPLADVPVLQLSLPSQDPNALLRLGAALRPLREHGVLVIGSGFMTHGLPFLTSDMFLGRAVPGWTREFDAWAAEAIAAGDLDELAAYRHRAPGMPYAHPTPEHFTPLFVTLGAADGPVRTAIEGTAMGLAKRSLEVA
jgi:4,5-DOPA dioxygenase extradiol